MIIWDVSYQDAVQIIETQFTDHLGLPVQADGDRGDTASRVGLIYALRFLNEGMTQDLKDKFENALNQIEIESAVYVRHPDGTTPYPSGLPPEEYVADPKQFSRDQEEPIKIAMGFYPEQIPRLQRLYEKRLSTSMVYQNGDIPGPANEGTYMRSFGSNWYYPILSISDLDLLVNAGIRLVARKINPTDTSNDVVLSLMFLQAEQRTGTIISWIAKQIYKLSNTIQD